MASKVEEHMPSQSSQILHPSMEEFSHQRRMLTTSYTDDPSMKNDTAPEQTYTPLFLYVELNLDIHALYQEFTHYLLTWEQLQFFGFPEEAPGRPGRAIMRTQNLMEGSTERRCCRCGSAFTILRNEQYVSGKICKYHPKKLTFRRGTSIFPCCNRNYTDEGCMTWVYHVTAESALHDVEFKQTKNKRYRNEPSVYALDCEMVYTTNGMEVVKVGLVGVDGLTVFETFVLPENQILDFNTTYSGVTEKDLKGVTTTLQDVQSYMLKLLNKESILVGHSLENDLKALRLIHYNIVDTSVAFPHKKSNYKKSLKSLAQEVLHKEIQMSSKGHNCIEDARTCMDLMLHKIHSDLEAKKYVTENENTNSILQNSILPEDLSYFEYQANSTSFASYSNSSSALDYSMSGYYHSFY